MTNMTMPADAGRHPKAFAELMRVRGLPLPAAGAVRITGADPFYRTPFRIGETVAAALAAIGTAASDIWELRTGRRQRVAIDVRHAAATLRTVDYSRRRGRDGLFQPIPIPDAMAHMLTVTQPWPARDGRWFLPHLNLQHLAARVLGVLECENTPAGVAAAVARWNAGELEEAIAGARACGGVIRTRQEWRAHAQGRFLAARPVVNIVKVADSAPMPFPAGDRPLSGIRALDLTRILAGPIAGRSLAEHGADVLMVTAPHLPQASGHVRDTSHGKRSCFLDLRMPADADRFAALINDADVFIDGYRPGVLDKFGFGAQALLARRPGLIYLAIDCFGPGGPFAGRAGWEQVAQAVTGVCQTYGELTNGGKPKLVFAPMCDYTTGYLAAYGTMLALARRAREGGSYRVEVSLCRSAMFIQDQGLLEQFADAPERLSGEELGALSVEADTPYGRLRTLGPVLAMSETPCHWARPTPELGGDAPQWSN